MTLGIRVYKYGHGVLFFAVMIEELGLAEQVAERNDSLLIVCTSECIKWCVLGKGLQVVEVKARLILALELQIAHLRSNVGV